MRGGVEWRKKKETEWKWEQVVVLFGENVIKYHSFAVYLQGHHWDSQKIARVTVIFTKIHKKEKKNIKPTLQIIKS